jgi:hypothetical protein
MPAPVQGLDAPIDVVMDHAADCLPARSSDSQSEKAERVAANLDPDRPSFMDDRPVQVMASSRSSSTRSRISASG